MKLPSKAIVIALCLGFAPFGGAQAETRVVMDFGNVAFGYSDGYWDRDHQWHRWHHQSDWRRYRHDYREHAYGWRHDRDRDDHDKGWREHDRYW